MTTLLWLLITTALWICVTSWWPRLGWSIALATAMVGGAEAWYAVR